MIHVDEEYAVEAVGRKHRIVGRAELDRDIVELLALDPVGQGIAGIRDRCPRPAPAPSRRPPAPGGRYNSLRRRRHRRPTCPLAPRQAPSPAPPRPAGRAHPRSKSGRRRLAQYRARPWGNAARTASHGMRRARTAPPLQEAAYSTSSTSTFSPDTRCDKAAAMKRSRSPSSTSPGAVEVTPVRKSLTSW